MCQNSPEFKSILALKTELISRKILSCKKISKFPHCESVTTKNDVEQLAIGIMEMKLFLFQKAPVSGVPVPEVARVELAAAIVVLVVDRILARARDQHPPVRRPPGYRAAVLEANLLVVTKTIRKNRGLVMKRMKRCNNFWWKCYPWFELQRYILLGLHKVRVNFLLFHTVCKVKVAFTAFKDKDFWLWWRVWKPSLYATDCLPHDSSLWNIWENALIVCTMRKFNDFTWNHRIFPFENYVTASFWNFHTVW